MGLSFGRKEIHAEFCRETPRKGTACGTEALLGGMIKVT
jgi:hypothetical protein